MTSKKQQKYVATIAIVLFLVGVVCYAAFPTNTPETPIRIMFHATAGKVLFDHKTHFDESEYGLSCKECHHHGTEDSEEYRACGDCHTKTVDGKSFPASCLDCHSESDMEDSLDSETGQYGLLEGLLKRSDAFHKQCIRCHTNYGSGPQEGSENCSSCHVSN